MFLETKLHILYSTIQVNRTGANLPGCGQNMDTDDELNRAIKGTVTYSTVRAQNNEISRKVKGHELNVTQHTLLQTKHGTTDESWSKSHWGL